jgi:KAP family P-loop domain protein
MSSIFINEVKLYMLLAIGLINLCLIYIIIQRVKITTENNIEMIENIITLKQLFENDFKKRTNEPILLKDEEVNYDLLGRNQIIDYIYDSIITIKTDRCFVISLEGKWGSGKSTIINNVKKKLEEKQEILVLDTFDPSVFNDNSVMLENMFACLLRKSGIKYNAFNIRKSIKKLPMLIFGGKSAEINDILLNEESIEDIKSQINDFLNASDKRYIFIIDNLDRVDNTNILTVFKLISGILNFDRVTYILSFDDERVKAVFKSMNVDYSYLKKIINLPVRVPEIHKETIKKLYRTSLCNILNAYNKIELITDLESYIDFLCECELELRDFCRLVNGPINYTLQENKYLNDKELIVLETIKFSDLELYKSIYSNRIYYISYNQDNNTALNIAFNKSKFNKQAKDYFEELHKKYSNYFSLLSEIFPYVERFMHKEDLEVEGFTRDNSQYNNAVKKRSISSGKYFDLYFCHSSNDFIIVDETVIRFIEKVNSDETMEIEKTKLLRNILEGYNHIFQKEFLQRLQISIGDIDSHMVVSSIRILISNKQALVSFPAGLELRLEDRLGLIIADLINMISVEELDCILEEEKENLYNLKLWFQIFCNIDDEKIVEESKKKKVNLFLKTIVNNVISSSVDIYDEKNYSYKNIEVLNYFCKNNPERLRGFFSTILNQDNIYKFLLDVVSITLNFTEKNGLDTSHVNYYFEPGAFSKFIGKEKIKELLSKKHPATEIEALILEVFSRFEEAGNEKMKAIVIENKYTI